MPITEETFTGMDITKMEILMHSLYEEHRKKREATFRPPKSTSSSVTTTPAEGVVVAANSISATTPVEITVSPQAVGSPFALPSGVTETSSADKAAVGVTSTSTVHPIDPTKNKSADGSEDKGGGLNGTGTTEGQPSKENGHVVEEEVKKDADVKPSPEPANVHIGYTCNGCKGSIAGSRFRCLE